MDAEERVRRKTQNINSSFPIFWQIDLSWSAAKIRQHRWTGSRLFDFFFFFLDLRPNQELAEWKGDVLFLGCFENILSTSVRGRWENSNLFGWIIGHVTVWLQRLQLHHWQRSEVTIFRQNTANCWGFFIY